MLLFYNSFCNSLSKGKAISISSAYYISYNANYYLSLVLVNKIKYNDPNLSSKVLTSSKCLNIKLI